MLLLLHKTDMARFAACHILYCIVVAQFGSVPQAMLVEQQQVDAAL